jgi:hypothetical protein
MYSTSPRRPGNTTGWARLFLCTCLARLANSDVTRPFLFSRLASPLVVYTVFKTVAAQALTWRLSIILPSFASSTTSGVATASYGKGYAEYGFVPWKEDLRTRWHQIELHLLN